MTTEKKKAPKKIAVKRKIGLVKCEPEVSAWAQIRVPGGESGGGGLYTISGGEHELGLVTPCGHRLAITLANLKILAQGCLDTEKAIAAMLTRAKGDK